MNLEEGWYVKILVDDFKNTQHPREENPRMVEGEVTGINEDVNRNAGEIQRIVAVGGPKGDGCYIDVGDMRDNNLNVGGSTVANPFYSTVWVPRRGRDRLTYGRVVRVEVVPVCDRCGDELEKSYPVDNPPEGPHEVCPDCLKPEDEVVQV